MYAKHVCVCWIADDEQSDFQIQVLTTQNQTSRSFRIDVQSVFMAFLMLIILKCFNQWRFFSSFVFCWNVINTIFQILGFLILNVWMVWSTKLEHEHIKERMNDELNWNLDLEHTYEGWVSEALTKNMDVEHMKSEWSVRIRKTWAWNIRRVSEWSTE